jgi:hypothetical protein
MDTETPKRGIKRFIMAAVPMPKIPRLEDDVVTQPPPPPSRGLDMTLATHRDYECVICREIARPPAMTCSGGCPYCRGCLLRAFKIEQQQPELPITGECPACRQQCVFVSCPLIDRAVRDDPATCRNMCGTAGLTVASVEAHEVDCPSRFIACRFANVGCTWAGRHTAEDEHAKSCQFQLAERFNVLSERLARRYEAKVTELQNRHNVILTALHGVMSQRTMDCLSVTLPMANIDEMPEFTVSQRTFSFRAEYLIPDPGRKPMLGCCVVNSPSRGPAVIRKADEHRLWIRLQVILLSADAAVGYGTVLGTLSESVPSALPTNFVVPITQPPPWSVVIQIIGMRLVDPEPFMV